MSKDDEQVNPSEPEEGSAPSGRRGRTLIVGLLSAVAGAVAALLLTPWRGAEARQKVKDGAAAARSAVNKKTASLGRRKKEEKSEDKSEDK